MALRGKPPSEPAKTVMLCLLVCALYLCPPQIKGWVSGLYDVNVNCNQALLFNYGNKMRFCSMYAYARFYAPPAGDIGLSGLLQFPSKLDDLELFYARMGVILFF
jgi:hypothetical protein